MQLNPAKDKLISLCNFIDWFLAKVPKGMSYTETIPLWIVQASKQCVSEGAQAIVDSKGKRIRYVFGPYEVVQTIHDSVITWQCPCPTNGRYACHHILAAQQFYGRIVRTSKDQQRAALPDLTQIASNYLSEIHREEALRILRDYTQKDADFALYILLRTLDQLVEKASSALPAQILDAILLPCYRGAQPSQKLLHRFEGAAKRYIELAQRAVDQSNFVQAAELVLSLFGPFHYLLSKLRTNNVQLLKQLDALYQVFEDLALRVEARPLIHAMTQRIVMLLSKSYYRFIRYPDPLLVFVLNHVEPIQLIALYDSIERSARRIADLSKEKADSYLLSVLNLQLIAQRIGKPLEEVFRTFYTDKKHLLWAMDWLTEEEHNPMKISMSYWGAMHFRSIALAELYLHELYKIDRLPARYVQEIIQLMIHLQSTRLLHHPFFDEKTDLLKTLEHRLQSHLSHPNTSAFLHHVRQRVRQLERSSVGGEA